VKCGGRQRVLISAAVDVFAEQLLGCAVGDRAHSHVRLRQPRTASIVSVPRIDRFHVESRCRVGRNEDVRKKINDLLATGARRRLQEHIAEIQAEQEALDAARHWPDRPPLRISDQCAAGRPRREVG
jgi:hypothetical protein